VTVDEKIEVLNHVRVAERLDQAFAQFRIDHPDLTEDGARARRAVDLDQTMAKPAGVGSRAQGALL
jgi:hypothetical protein